MIVVESPGAFTSIQDLGRPGHAALGVAPSGAFDALALRAANLCVGNPEGAAGLEITVTGPALRFERDAVAALAGSRMTCDAPHLEAFPIPAGSTLTTGRTAEGARAYLAVRGGITAPSVLGSASTDQNAGFGRALTAGDAMGFGELPDALLRRIAPGALPRWAPEATVRALPGPQSEAFTEEARAAFFGAGFTVSPRSNRVGARLEGPALAHATRADLDPEGVPLGGVQVPADGRPIVLGPDRPATGGYAKIATVIAADICLIAQAKPGDRLRFVEVSLEDARAAWAERERALHRIEAL